MYFYYKLFRGGFCVSRIRDVSKTFSIVAASDVEAE
jgi:hypothetical protein